MTKKKTINYPDTLIFGKEDLISWREIIRVAKNRAVIKSVGYGDMFDRAYFAFIKILCQKLPRELEKKNKYLVKKRKIRRKLHP